MRTRIAMMVMLCLVGCGSPETHEDAGAGSREGEGEGADEAAGEREVAGESESESEGEVASDGAEPRSATGPSCDRVRPCIEAFVEVAPSELAAPARVALGQLDVSLAESSAREPACAAAIGSYRHDLETREIAIPEACR